jgi:ornithine cyclodeaminase
LGSYQEVDYDVITQADKVIVDSWKYASPRIPEIIHLVKSGKFKFDDVHAEWPSVVAGESPGRESSEEIIIFMALGIWGEYAAILPEVFRKAVDMGLGQSLPRSY